MKNNYREIFKSVTIKTEEVDLMSLINEKKEFIEKISQDMLYDKFDDIAAGKQKGSVNSEKSKIFTIGKFKLKNFALPSEKKGCMTERVLERIDRNKNRLSMPDSRMLYRSNDGELLSTSRDTNTHHNHHQTHSNINGEAELNQTHRSNNRTRTLRKMSTFMKNKLKVTTNIKDLLKINFDEHTLNAKTLEKQSRNDRMSSVFFTEVNPEYNYNNNQNAFSPSRNKNSLNIYHLENLNNLDKIKSSILKKENPVQFNSSIDMDLLATQNKSCMSPKNKKTFYLQNGNVNMKSLYLNNSNHSLNSKHSEKLIAKKISSKSNTHNSKHTSKQNSSSLVVKKKSPTDLTIQHYPELRLKYKSINKRNKTQSMPTQLKDKLPLIFQNCSQIVSNNILINQGISLFKQSSEKKFNYLKNKEKIKELKDFGVDKITKKLDKNVFIYGNEGRGTFLDKYQVIQQTDIANKIKNISIFKAGLNLNKMQEIDFLNKANHKLKHRMIKNILHDASIINERVRNKIKKMKSGV